MQFQRIEISNFRPYRDAEVDLKDVDGHIHVIEGPQGAGKTSLHTAIQWGLYGGHGPGTNYRSNWNETAQEEDDEEMYVHIEFREDARDHILKRSIRNFSHSQERATEEVSLIIGGDTYKSGDNAQEYIGELLPEQLKDFFFLDGEKIQTLVDDDEVVDVKEDIETVLKHQAIINAKEDLQAVIKDRYEPKRNRLEKEKAKRDEFTRKIRGNRDEKQNLKKRREDLLNEREEVSDDIEEVKAEIERHDEEVIQALDDVKEDIRDLEGNKQEALSDLRDAWEMAPIAIVSDNIEGVCDEIHKQEAHYESLRSSLERQDILRDLQQQASDGMCPICGNDHPDDLPELDFDDEVEESEAALSQQIYQCRQTIRTLRDAPLPNEPPTEPAKRLQQIREDLRDKEDDEDALMDDVGGRPEESERQRLEEQLRSLQSRHDEIERELDDVRDDIQEKDDKIDTLQDKKRKKKGREAIDKVQDKIDAAKTAIDHLDTIRSRHIADKRAAIKDTMDAVFDQVSQSEFISNRYNGIGFRGAPEEEDSYVLELVKNSDERKDMKYRPPSAGETQLMALSFIFGLNEYAKYSTTIVFDTVAGRLDLENSRAQGEFFASLDEPIILLVTDAEMAKLEEAIQGDLGKRYRIRPDGDMNSTLELVNG
jgi:DNA sulfur modification protein DndD